MSNVGSRKVFNLEIVDLFVDSQINKFTDDVLFCMCEET